MSDWRCTIPRLSWSRTDGHTRCSIMHWPARRYYGIHAYRQQHYAGAHGELHAVVKRGGLRAAQEKGDWMILVLKELGE